MKTREEGKIGGVHSSEYGKHFVTNIDINFKGSVQGFGGLALTKDLSERLLQDLAQVFGTTVEGLNGQTCFALRSFARWNSSIEGLEAPNGKRLLLTAWRRKMGFPGKNPLEDRRETLLLRAGQLTRQMEENAEELANLDGEYVSWE